jgi:hypothetical protein
VQFAHAFGAVTPETSAQVLGEEVVVAGCPKPHPTGAPAKDGATVRHPSGPLDPAQN